MSLNLDSIKLAAEIKRHALRMVHGCNGSHIGACYSIADIVAVLYASFLNVDPKLPLLPARDRFILSKGHAAAILYATLAECGFIDVDELSSYSLSGSRLKGHVCTEVPGIELSTGSLGHGLPVATGIALAAKRDSSQSRVVVLVGDGELNEGSCWESILFAPKHNLDNLIVIVDRNNLQGLGRTEDIVGLSPLDAKFAAFGWGVQTIDGHDHTAIIQALRSAPFESDKPNVIIANTVKGKGVSFMEDSLAWHYKSPNADQLATALAELETFQE